MSQKTWVWTIGAALFSFAGCGHAPPRELASAQRAYYQASAGPAAQVAPDELHKARVALTAAEKAAADEPTEAKTLDLIYIAERKAQLAGAKARLTLAKQDKEQADKNFTSGLVAKNEMTKEQLEQARLQKNAAEAANAQTTVALQAETAARLDAERRADLAMQDLAKIAQMREEQRGTVMVLPGDLLFVSDQAELLSSALMKLDQIAEALKLGNNKLIIEGHTDSRGTDAYNMDLSRRRADSVRNYLVSRGVTADRFEIVAYGEQRPVTGNESAEGRANNRRVEIVVEGRRSAALR